MAGKNINNRFTLFQDKTSLAKKYSRMLNGGNTETKGNKLGWWERIDIERDIFTDKQYVLGVEHEGRPDLVAASIYGRTSLMWLVLQYNSIVDIEEEFVTGKTITLPTRNRLFSEIAVENPERESSVNE